MKGGGPPASTLSKTSSAGIDCLCSHEHGGSAQCWAELAMVAFSTVASAELGKAHAGARGCLRSRAAQHKLLSASLRSVSSHLEEACCQGVRTALEVAFLAGVDHLQPAWGGFLRTERTDFSLAALLVVWQGSIRMRIVPPALHT